MKKRIEGIVTGILTGVILSSSVALAAKTSKRAELFYNNIKIFVDGGEIVPKDVSGNVVEPFIMDGTTYLPVRAISNALGQEVEWDGATQSVYIGKKDRTKPDNYLNKIQYNDYKENSGDTDFAIINGTITDHNGNDYVNGLVFYNNTNFASIEEDIDEAAILLSYPLNSQYETLCGKIVLPKSVNIKTWKKNDNCKTSGTEVWIYGDGKLLYKATNVTSSMPFSFETDVYGVNQIDIKIKTEGYYSYVALTDLALYK